MRAEKSVSTPGGPADRDCPTNPYLQTPQRSPWACEASAIDGPIMSTSIVFNIHLSIAP